MPDKFKVGDVVYLKSGGPAMTVVDKREGYSSYSDDSFSADTALPEEQRYGDHRTSLPDHLYALHNT